MSRNPIYTYLPNLIGYVRLLLALLSIVFYNQPGIFFFCYFACFCGDGLDGYAARKTNHVTLFGSLLDMFTDRGCIVALFCNLASLYPMLSGFFMALAFLDVASHFVRMYSSQLLGFTSHKDSKSSHSTPLLNMYYKSRTVTVLKIYIHVQQLRSGMMDIADTELKTLKKSHKT
ncbi:putative CDP-diacylglycerol--inositol 3-phosphatidyltransferase 1 [Blattamonas nauphoetae]|uniref:CDP-diacylglycerol--inositol 3-phosphatidyltransferase n=1 Tax=Blattamonas nauphoetae TaxID=2049346 RepID=A0ABQ9XKF6_9EUKA|nr:putative CDP-diacylglycerol--inositol 3-phosphatidyltransferase 1 [Blattamonas nauphoetae]